jgi:hypothetical protein
MKPKLHDEVLELSIDIVDASGVGDTKAEWNAYQKLLSLCEKNESGDLNHPFQWEALADFTSDSSASIAIYNKALIYAEQLMLIDYIASIKLAIAEVHLEAGNHDQAINMARDANESAKLTTDLELRKEISEFLLQSTKST